MANKKNTSSKKMNIFVIDDNVKAVELITAMLEQVGYQVTSSTDSSSALKTIKQNQPDCIIADLIMPGVDGLSLCQSVRDDASLNDVKFIMVSAKAYDFDYKRALEFGADGYIKKPLNPKTFTDKIARVLDDHIDMRFWGVRGTLPVSGEDYLKYGGSTSCVTLEFPREQFFIFDGGTGIKKLGDWILSQSRKRFNAKMFISHPHWDHINAIPFFNPLYIQGGEFEILGPNQGDISMREIISAQMDGVYFPINISEFASRVYFKDLDEEQLIVDGINISTKLLSHPGRCLGYRVDYNGRSICYITDNEMFPETSEYYNQHYEDNLADFCRDSDVLITDCTYTDEEYKTKECFGHSSISKVVGLATEAEVKNLYLFHHDPDQNDQAIDRKLDLAMEAAEKRNSNVQIHAPVEGTQVKV